ncbi:MAG: iron-siderophore ABC transporter substrate-binding protein [Actinomycetota bacterium]|nr:iron-siderophore ABC transporter substrate-binding protein [Actinomycetota bacterium]
MPARPRAMSALLVVVSCLALTACGVAPQPETAPPPTAVDGTEQAAFPRTLTHAMGTTTIPAPPQRVVVLDTGELDSVTALGITPVGAVRAPVEDGLLDYLQAETQGTQLVGTISEPDLEKIATLNPDLILSSKLRHEAIYDELSQIAPTVFTETVGVVWKDNFLVHAEALGAQEQAAKMLADYEQRANELGQRVGDRTISLVRFLPDEIRLYQKESFIGTILSDVGLPRPPSQDVADFAAVVGPEQVELMDGDVIFYTSYGPPGETAQPQVVTSQLWQNLDAVQQGDVHEVPDDYWMLGIGIQAANLVLDDLERILLEARSTP